MDSILVWYWPLAAVLSWWPFCVSQRVSHRRFPAPWAMLAISAGNVAESGLTESILIVINNGVEGWGDPPVAFPFNGWPHRHFIGPQHRQPGLSLPACIGTGRAAAKRAGSLPARPRRLSGCWRFPASRRSGATTRGRALELVQIFGTVIVRPAAPVRRPRHPAPYHLWDIDVIVRKDAGLYAV